MKTTTKRVLQVLLFCLLAAVLALGTAMATSAAEIPSGSSLDIRKTYTIGAEDSGYTLVYNDGWIIQDSSEKYLQVDYGNVVKWGNISSASTFSVAPGNNGATVSCQLGYNTMYLSYSNGSFSANAVSSNRVRIYDNNSGGESGGSTDPVTPQQTTSQNTVKLYFTNNKGWSDVYAYVWKEGGEAVETPWPGTALEKYSTNDAGQDIYSVSIDLDEYDRVIFNNGSENTKTESIDVTEALNKGSGIYIDDNDSSNPYSVNYYNHNIDFSKKIEKLNTNPDDYSYRLHLNVAGENLKSSKTETTSGESATHKLAIIIDATETMLSTSMTGSPSGENKFQTIQRLLKEENGFLEQYLDGNNEVAIIFIGGVAGYGVSYTQCYQVGVQKTTDINAARGNWSEHHFSHPISYTTAFLAAQDIFDPQNTGEKYSVLFFAGNAPGSYLDISTGETNNRVDSSQIGPKNVADCKSYMDAHPNVSFYGVGVASQSGDIEHGSTELREISEYGDGYYNATSVDKLSDDLLDIVTILLPGDRTNDLTVVDTLSDKVAFLGSDRTDINLTATMWLGNKEGAGTDVSDKVTVDFENKTVTFSGYGTIDGKFYLEIAFDIKTADDVFHESTGYPNTGDEDTDYDTNTTSSNQPGYFSNVKESSTVSYTLNSEPTRTAEFKQPVVQAPEPQDGVYKFTYPDRHENIYYGKDNQGDEGYFAYQMWTKTVTRRLKSAEIRGYSGNGDQAGVPTYLWTAEAQALFDFNPLVTASFEVQGNDYNYDNVSFYKHDIEWPTMIITELPANQSIKVDGSDVVVTAEAPEKTFTFKYELEQNGTITEGAENIKYAENVTFNPAYKGQEGIHVIEGVTLPENLTYWSSDAEGNDILTTVKTFGMLIRGGYTADDLENNVVTVYAQTKTPTGDEWRPVIEEATLTRVIADNEVNRYYADYMVDFLNINGDVVQYMINEGQNVQYGLVVMIADEDEAITQENMISYLNKLKTNEKQSAYIGDTEHVAAYFEYDDATHISDYNRTLFTINGKYENLKGKRITAMAYIIVPDADTQEKKYYTPVNTQIVIKKYDD